MIIEIKEKFSESGVMFLKRIGSPVKVLKNCLNARTLIVNVPLIS